LPEEGHDDLLVAVVVGVEIGVGGGEASRAAYDSGYGQGTEQESALEMGHAGYLPCHRRVAYRES
jgi:hypothetical protein